MNDEGSRYDFSRGSPALRLPRAPEPSPFFSGELAVYRSPVVKGGRRETKPIAAIVQSSGSDA